MVSVTGKVGDDEMVLTTEKGDRFTFYHDQDCCESVYVESITGDLADLVPGPADPLQGARHARRHAARPRP